MSVAWCQVLERRGRGVERGYADVEVGAENEDDEEDDDVSGGDEDEEDEEDSDASGFDPAFALPMDPLFHPVHYSVGVAILTT